MVSCPFVGTENVKAIENEIEKLVSGDKVVELLQTIPNWFCTVSSSRKVL